MRPVVNLLRLTGLPIRHQLALEESLLRATQQNWIVVNDGAFHPAIVMGISGCAVTCRDCTLVEALSCLCLVINTCVGDYTSKV